MKLYQQLAQTIQAYHNCVASGNNEWKEKHKERIKEIEKNLPSGAGIDNGTKVDISESNGERILLNTSFHHLDEHGFYTGWTDHKIVITPSFTGINVRVFGVNKNDIKSYLCDVYYNVLMEEE